MSSSRQKKSLMADASLGDVAGTLLSFSPAAFLTLCSVGPRETATRLAAAWRATDWHRRLPIRKLDDLLPIDDVSVTVPNLYLKRGSTTAYEKLCLAALVKHKAPKRIIEIGTFDGATTRLLAANAPDALVHTVDLPPGDAHTQAEVTERDKFAIEQRDVGHVYKASPEACRIAQHLCDSMAFDFEGLGERFDFAFIDGAHSYEYVKSDTEKILEVIGPNPVIAWHDYSHHYPGLVRYLNAAFGKRAVQIANTRLVVLLGGE